MKSAKPKPHKIGFTREQVRRGEFPPLLSLVPRALAREVRAARVNGEPLYAARERG